MFIFIYRYVQSLFQSKSNLPDGRTSVTEFHMGSNIDSSLQGNADLSELLLLIALSDIPADIDLGRYGFPQFLQQAGRNCFGKCQIHPLHQSLTDLVHDLKRELGVCVFFHIQMALQPFTDLLHLKPVIRDISIN